MHRYFFILGFLLGVASFSFSESPDFSIEVGPVFLKQLHPYKRSLAFCSSLPSTFRDQIEKNKKDSISLSGLVNAIHPEWGLTAAVKIFPSQKTTVELRYLGKLSWHSEKDELNFIQKEDAHLTHRVQCLYDSRFGNGECNAWHHITPRFVDYFSVSSMIGIRLFKVSDRIQIHFDTDPSYQIETNNFSLGLQIGGDMQCHPYPFLTLGILTKIGWMHNRNIKKINRPIQIFSHSNLSYLGEITPFIEWKPTKHFVFDIHYQALCIGGLTIGDRNVYFLPKTIFHNTTGHLIYHGFTGTIQFNF